MFALLPLKLNFAEWYSSFSRTQPFPQWDTKSLKIQRFEGMEMIKPTLRAGEQKGLHRVLKLMWSSAACSQKQSQWWFCKLQWIEKPTVCISLCSIGEQQDVLAGRSFACHRLQSPGLMSQHSSGYWLELTLPLWQHHQGLWSHV